MSSGPLVVVESSAGSTDLPRRPLVELGGVPLLEFQLRRLLPLTSHVGATVAVTATDQPIDDPVVEIAEGLGVPVVRGAAEDALGRYALALVRLGGDAVVRLADDAPLSDPYVVMAALALHRAAQADHTSNLLPRSYPTGLDVEVLTARALRQAEIEAQDPRDRARVTSYVLRRPEQYRLANLQSGHDLGEEPWRVESTADLQHLREIVGQVPNAATASWSHILSVVGRARKAKPGQVVLRPGPAPEPGSKPWVRTWQVGVDGATVGSVTVTAGSGRVQREFDVDDRWLEPAREALYRLLLHDPQAGP